MPYGFGSGALFGVKNVASGVATPVQFGALQEASIEFSFSTKELSGQYQMPVAVGRGKAKITGKAKIGEIDMDVYADLFFNETPAAGQVLPALNEAAEIPESPGPYTVAAEHAATFDTDLGVRWADTGLPLTRVASAPATGEYSVSEGTYTFAAADAEKAVLLNYTYTSPTGGRVITINNQLVGISPSFQVILFDSFEGQYTMVQLYRCSSSKLTLPTKMEDFLISDFDFEAMANAANQIGRISVPQ